MRMISWNVNGLRACLGKGFLDFFKTIDADIFCLQETKMQQGQAQVDSNNSLVLRPLAKEAQGRWECSASNAVARVTTSTNVYVLG